MNIYNFILKGEKMVLICIILGTFLIGLGSYIADQKKDGLAVITAMLGIFLNVGGILTFS